MEDKIKKSFEKLHKTLTKRNLSLFNIFETFDLDKSGFLTLDELNGILIKLDKSFEKEEVKDIFKAIDVDGSNTIDFF